MRYYYVIPFCILILVPHMAHTKHEPALICVPVADLVGQPMKNFYGRSVNSTLLYSKLPECGAGTLPHALRACPRLHQALLHDKVEIVDQRGSEVCIKIANTLFVTNNTVHQKTFWTRQSNLMPIRQIKNAQSIQQDAVVTLIKPIYIRDLDITLSVGTQLPCTPTQDSTNSLTVYILNAHAKKFEQFEIPKTHCLAHPNGSIPDRIDLFLSLLRNWARQTDGTIPYVWGGSSFTATNQAQTFETQKVRTPSGTHQLAYTYPSNTRVIKTGFDCSGLISRAAQMAGIPYYCKNSITASKLLAPLQKTDVLSAGDLIWFSGHIIVIANLQAHTIIEARGYEHGYGKVHEIPLSEQFEGINTYTDLLNAYHTQTPLKRLDKKGDVVQIIPHYKILKLSSVFSLAPSYATSNMLPIK